MDNIYKYIFSDKEITIINCNNKYWFNGLSIAEALEYTNTHKALKSYIPDKYIKSYADLTNDKKLNEQTIFISEAGLFRLIMKSKQINAVKFQDWVTDELLLTLRKTGEYKIADKILRDKIYNKYSLKLMQS